MYGGDRHTGQDTACGIDNCAIDGRLLRGSGSGQSKHRADDEQPSDGGAPIQDAEHRISSLSRPHGNTRDTTEDRHPRYDRGSMCGLPIADEDRLTSVLETAPTFGGVFDEKFVSRIRPNIRLSSVLPKGTSQFCSSRPSGT